jgi:tRNA(fMet)-specific endonuclease VapC
MLDAFFAAIVTLPFDEADAKTTAAIRAALKTQGQPIGAYDVLIAGTGLARGLVVVTSNVGEFKRVSGLQVENWR